MCKLFQDHHTKLGYRCPANLAAKIVKYMHRSGAAAHASPQAQCFSGRAAPAVDGTVDTDYDADDNADCSRDVYGKQPVSLCVANSVWI